MTNLTWRRAAGCASGDCVLVALDGDAVLVRDSKLGDNSPTLTFTAAQWTALVEDVAEGALPDGAFLRLDDGWIDLVGSTADGPASLTFTRAEWNAFVEGVRAGEFDLDRPAAGAR